MTALTPHAFDAYPGMVVRKHIPGSEVHVIQSTEQLKDEHGFVTGIRVTTNQGSWVFDPREVVTFPRRDDGSVRLWDDPAAPPLVADLAVGDTLLPNEAHPRDRHDGWDTMHPTQREIMEDVWKSGVQRVSAVYADKRGMPLMWVSTRTPDGAVHRYQCLINDRMTFPRSRHVVQGEGSVVKAQTVQPRKYTAHGPYEIADQIVFAAEHPQGRGRWPNILNEGGVDLGMGVVLRRVYEHEWEEAVFLGDDRLKRHPRDPLRHQIAHEAPAARDPEQVMVLEAVYDAYRADKPVEQHLADMGL